jgi:lambda family phage portal protein
MGFFWNRKKEEPKVKSSTRAFNAASFGPTLDLSESISINNDIRGGIETIRRRARSMVQNDGTARGIINNLKNNIIGSRGISLTCQAINSRTGGLDTKGNQFVENLWRQWSKYGEPDAEGKKSWVMIQEIVLQTLVTDGECLILFRRGSEYGRFSFQLEIIPVDQLDANYFSVTPEGNIIFQGCEIDDKGKPLAYHIFEHNRNDPQTFYNRQNRRIRVPAEDMIHLYQQEAPKQIRGISWFASALINVHHLSLLLSTELQMARLATLKSVVYSISSPEDFQIGPEELDAAAMINRNLAPGEVEILPPGMTAQAIDWDSPNSGLSDITKTILRNISSSLGLNYNSLSQDMESVNYSSARFQALETRENYRSKQRFFIEAFVERVYSEWLSVQFMTGTIPYPFEKYNKFLDVKFTARGWESVDPAKEMSANSTALLLGIKTRSEICQQQGRDLEEILQEQIREEQMRVELYAAANLPLPVNNPILVPLAVAEEAADSNEVEEPENKPKKSKS